MKLLYRLIKLILPSVFAAVLFSCSYGFFNFTAETGSLELNLEFANDNAMNIDKVKYELTPPKGLSSTLSSDISGFSDYRSLDRMDTGAWSVKGEFYAAGELVQEFSYGIEILTDMRTRLRIEARWNGSEYEIIFQSWQEPEDGSGDGITAAVPAFDVTEIKLIPAYYLRNTEQEYYSVNVCILGSELDSAVQSLELRSPDGYSYEYGYDSGYSRGVLITLQDSYSLIEILRNQLIPGGGANGEYYLRLRDYNGVSKDYTRSLDFNYTAVTPVSTGYNAESIVPATILPAGPHDFGYAFDSAAGISTRLVYLINRTTNEIIPPDDSMAVGFDTGTLNVPGALSSGSWEFVTAAIGYPTLTPVTDAGGAGIGPADLMPETLAAGIYEIYGENTGYVCFSSASFIVP